MSEATNAVALKPVDALKKVLQSDTVQEQFRNALTRIIHERWEICTQLDFFVSEKRYKNRMLSVIKKNCKSNCLL